MSTPDGNMVSLVLQMGDCNAPATYQSLMNYVFSPYIGRFLDVYLDDVIIYSETLDDHVKHCKLAIDILRKEKLYLSKKKLRFLPDELKLLGRIIDLDGIKMDPEKVDDVLAWKTPTNRDLLRGFIGSVGYLADDIPNIRIPLGILSAITGDKVPFRWTHTEHRAFEEAKNLVHAARNHSRHPITYGPNAEQVWMVTDGCLTGIAGVVSQGSNWKTAKVAAFYSAKLNSAQRNYPVHEIEMLAGVETMLRHRDILQGVHFNWITDHKGLIHLLNQKNVSGRQARWLEKISSFVFKVEYAAGSENLLADALSRMYSNDCRGTERARSEFTSFDIMDEDPVEIGGELTLLAGMEAIVATHKPPRSKKLLGAETGRPETSREFAQRMKEQFVLRGPREPTEGGKESTKENLLPSNNGHAISSDNALDDLDHDRDNNSSEPKEASIPIPEATLVNALETEAGLNLPKELKGQYQNDPAFKMIMDKPKDFRNFEVKDDLIYLKLNGKNLLCIPKILIKERSVHELIIAEAHSILAHLGASKTLNYLRDHVWWKTMVTDTQAYCGTCVTCKRSKPDNQKPYGLLNPLATPAEPWESIGVDFVGPLPLSHNRDGEYDSIAVVICLLTSMVEIMPSHTTYKAKDIAEMMFENVYKHHGLPKTIVSDRDSLFTSTFWERLNELIGIKLRMSSAYHPQTDGATERVNRTVTQMLRQCINPKQKDWVSKLPAIQFAINSARSESTGYTPFFLNNGRMPRVMVWNSAKPTEFSNVREFAQKKKLALISAHDSIISARIKQIRHANRKRQPVPFELGDFVYLSTKYITFSKGLARKLIPKYIGPYKIIQDFNNQSFKLELPMHLKKRGVHDVFHSSLLRIHMPNDDRLFPGRMDTQLGVSPEADDEWAVDLIRTHAGSGEDSMFEILWKSGDITWMPYFQIKQLQALDTYLELLGIDEIAKLPEGKGNPPRDDPQVFVGALNYDSTQLFTSPSLSNQFKNETYDSYNAVINLFENLPTASFLSELPHFDTQPSDHPILDDTLTSNNIHTLVSNMTLPDGIKHPSFVRVSKTEYALLDSNNKFRSIIHVGQIVKYLIFDQALREGKKIYENTERPYGYLAFANMFNRDAHPRDSRRLSTYITTASGQYQVLKSGNPVFLHEFRITSDQCGVETPRPALSETQAAVFEEYATTMANQNAKRRKAIQDRQEKRREIFRKPNSRKRRYFDTDPEYDPVTSLRIEAGGDHSFFYDMPTNNSSPSVTSLSVQPTVIPAEVPDTSNAVPSEVQNGSSDYFMGNSEPFSAVYVDPLAHLNLSESDNTTYPAEPRTEEDGEIEEMPE